MMTYAYNPSTEPLWKSTMQDLVKLYHSQAQKELQKSQAKAFLQKQKELKND